MKANLIFRLLLPGFLLVSLNAISQPDQLDKEDRKEIKKAKMTATYNMLDSLINSKKFVLEADFLQNMEGYMIPVTPSVNFIMVDDSTGIVQTGGGVGLGGNGVGGITAAGSISNWKLNKDSKKLSYSLRFDIMSNLGYYNILMKVFVNKASATVTGSTSGRLTWEGHLKKIDNSRNFKGAKTVPNLPVRIH